MFHPNTLCLIEILDSEIKKIIKVYKPVLDCKELSFDLKDRFLKNLLGHDGTLSRKDYKPFITSATKMKDPPEALRIIQDGGSGGIYDKTILLSLADSLEEYDNLLTREFFVELYNNNKIPYAFNDHMYVLACPHKNNTQADYDEFIRDIDCAFHVKWKGAQDKNNENSLIDKSLLLLLERQIICVDKIIRKEMEGEGTLTSLREDELQEKVDKGEMSPEEMNKILEAEKPDVIQFNDYVLQTPPDQDNEETTD